MEVGAAKAESADAAATWVPVVTIEPGSRLRIEVKWARGEVRLGIRGSRQSSAVARGVSAPRRLDDPAARGDRCADHRLTTNRAIWRRRIVAKARSVR